MNKTSMKTDRKNPIPW